MAEQKNAQNVDVNQLLKVRREKLQDLQERGKDPFQITKYDMTHHSMEIKDNFDELEGKTVSIAGRMMFKRVMGKASFCTISATFRFALRFSSICFSGSFSSARSSSSSF